MIAVHLFIAAHIAHWLITGQTLSPLEPSEAMELSKHGVINAGFVLFAAAIVSTALFGRFFCGWGCHLIALQDLSRWLLLRIGIRPRPLRSRLLAIVPMLAFVYMFIWPAAYRLWLGDDLSPTSTAYRTSGFWDTFPGWSIGILTFVICGGAIVFFLGSKGFCTYACPYGAVLGLADRLAPMRIRVTDACQRCGACSSACTSNVRVAAEVHDFGMVVDSGCMKCLDCVATCPNDALYLGLGRPSIGAKAKSLERTSSRRLSWSDEILLVIAFAMAFFTFRGLYGSVPFLMALGVAAVLALWTLTLERLRRDRNVRLGAVLLRQQGTLLEAGTIFLVISVPIGLLWMHSAVVHLDTARGEARYRSIVADLNSMLDLDRTLEPLSDDLQEPVAKARRFLERADRWGLARHPRLDLEIAWLALAEGQGEVARDRLTSSLKEYPNIALSHLLAARLLVDGGQTEQATAAYSRAIELDPRQTSAYLGLGFVLARGDELDEAILVFERGLLAQPNSADLHYNAGLAEALVGKVQPAIERFEKALELDPEHQAARENLMELFRNLGKHEEAANLQL